MGWLPPALAGLVIGALFILPFLLFSATSGQLTDKYDKTAHDPLRQEPRDRASCCWPPGASSPANVPVLLACVFLMGLHSTLFGPVKFAYLPQHLSERELTGGNGMVEMGTFVAILLGNVAGGLLVAVPGVGAAATWRWPAWRWRWSGAAVAQFIPPCAGHRPGPEDQLEPGHAKPGAT